MPHLPPRIPTFPHAFTLLSTAFIAGRLLGQEAIPPAGAHTPAWPDQPLSVADCLNVAFMQNPRVLASNKDIEAVYGISIQTKAVIVPKIQASGDFGVVSEGAVDRLEIEPAPGLPTGFSVINPGTERWSAGVRLVQSVFEGGRLLSSVRASRLQREQVLAQHQAVLADVATDIRVTYYDVLLAGQQIQVSEASLKLLQQELEDSQRRFNAGVVPRFNVLRAEVARANGVPALSRARNAYRITKNLLVNQLGYRVPKEIWDDIPLRLTDTLDVPRLDIQIPAALTQALERRPELVALRAAEQLRKEGVVSARAGYFPRVEGYLGYHARKSNFGPNLSDEVHGWEAGVQAIWNIFDGDLTRGKVIEASALRDKSQLDTDDAMRRIELEVRTAYSTLVEAWEVLESQQKVLEQADEALRLATARAEAGSGTQLDVLSAQTALTDARTTHIRAKREYAVARARLERAIGAYTAEPAPATTRR